MGAAEFPMLEAIHSPADVKRLTPEQLPALADEMRRYLIRTLAPIGGHLGAGLGVVELTIALHYLFDSPRDRIVWDVGHQAYPHKMLTGRFTRMPTIRQYDGLSGFTKRSESEHDPFGAGHASTSISAAYGMAVGRDLQGESNHAIAVIGDGALTGGMAFEALNHAGARRNRLLVILNDNEMSIAPNVGAVSAYLARIITGRTYTGVKDTAKRVLSRLPGALDAARRLEEHVKGMITPGTLFEELGFRYIGPIDGHDFEHLLPTLANCKHLDGPVLLHVLTRKGLGFSPAEEDPETWHGLGPYDPENGCPLPAADNGPPSYTQVFADTLADLADQDARIVAITAAMPGGTGLARFARRHPERCFDVGIAEQHAVTFAGGLAVEGLRPVVAIYSTFLQRGYDQIIHDICIQNLPVVFCMDRAGIVGADGATHTGSFDIAFLRCLPNITVMAPKDENELRSMLATALTLPGPSAIRYPRGLGLGVEPEPVASLPVGKAETLAEGTDGLVVAVGTRVHDAAAAIAARSKKGQRFGLINLRFVKPLDTATIVKQLPKDKPLVVVEEGSRLGGIGEAIAVEMLSQGWHGPFVHLGIPDVFPAQGSQAEILRDLGLDATGIATALARL